MQLTFETKKLTVTCGEDTLVIEQADDGVAEVFMNGEPAGSISLSDE